VVESLTGVLTNARYTKCGPTAGLRTAPPAEAWGFNDTVTLPSGSQHITYTGTGTIPARSRAGAVRQRDGTPQGGAWTVFETERTTRPRRWHRAGIADVRVSNVDSAGSGDGGEA